MRALVTGGAGFVGTNLINLLLKKTKYKIISLDNYSSGSKKNHIKNKRINYLKGDTKNISKIIKNTKDIISVLKLSSFNLFFIFILFGAIYAKFIVGNSYNFSPHCVSFVSFYLGFIFFRGLSSIKFQEYI